MIIIIIKIIVIILNTLIFRHKWLDPDLGTLYFSTKANVLPMLCKQNYAIYYDKLRPDTKRKRKRKSRYVFIAGNVLQNGIKSAIITKHFFQSETQPNTVKTKIYARKHPKIQSS